MSSPSWPTSPSGSCSGCSPGHPHGCGSTTPKEPSPASSAPYRLPSVRAGASPPASMCCDPKKRNRQRHSCGAAGRDSFPGIPIAFLPCPFWAAGRVFLCGWIAWCVSSYLLFKYSSLKLLLNHSLSSDITGRSWATIPILAAFI